MNTIPHLSNSAIPIARDDLERILRALTAFQQASGLAAAIILDRLNAVDGDPDLEAEPDDEDDDPQGQSTEDEISCGAPGFGNRGPGCPISDPDKGVDDDGEAIDEREPRAYYPMLPRYGDDQSKGPINQVEILRDHHHRLRTDPDYCN